MAQSYNEQLKFYRVVKTFIEGDRQVRRNVGHNLERSPIVFDNLWEPLGVYYSALEEKKSKSLSVLELLVKPVSEISDDLTHYVIEFEALPQYQPRVRWEYRSKNSVEPAIGRSLEFIKEARLYGVELETIIRPLQEEVQQNKKPKK